MNYAGPGAGPPIDPVLHQQLMEEGIADADARGRAIDHLTARRLATWLAAQPRQQVLAAALARFIRTGAISQEMKDELRARAYSPHFPYRVQAHRLLQYCASRGTSLGPVSPDFARDCDQLDHADAILIGLRDRIRDGTQPAPAWPETEGPPVTARAERDPASHMVSLILDETSANIAMHAIAAHAADREAHVREVTQFARGLPDDSYGKRNRHAIAARDTRVAQRLRAIERAYQAAPDRETEPPAGRPATLDGPPRAAGREIEMG